LLVFPLCQQRYLNLLIAFDCAVKCGYKVDVLGSLWVYLEEPADPTSNNVSVLKVSSIQPISSTNTHWRMWLLLYWATVILFFITALFLLYIPLPPDISDRKKLQVLEFLLRIGYEYPGDLIEFVLGPRIRNQYIRLLITIGYIIPWPTPSFVKVRFPFGRAWTCLILKV
ncbi:hypothetical protein ANCCAN_18890, partial [Ancylostoma caninum]